MTEKRFLAETMTEALAQVKREMGRDAVILRTRNFRKGKILGLFGGRSMWEVTAEGHAGPRRTVDGHEGAVSASQSLEGRYDQAREQVHRSREAPRQSISLDGVRPDEPGETHLEPRRRGDVREIHQMVSALLEMHSANADTSLPAELAELKRELLDQDVAEPLAESLLARLCRDVPAERLHDRRLALQRLEALLIEQFTTAATPATRKAEGSPRLLAMIGPTGVGKTTTIAKLAATFKLRHSAKVGLVTLDTYRIAAVDQLRTYANIIEVPLTVALSPEELRAAVESMQDLDVVLVDTAGRSPTDSTRLRQLSGFLGAVDFDEVHLLLSAAAGARSLERTLERFAPLGANRILLTKLDEAVTFGMLLNVATASAMPVSYVTTGQNVPDDIAPAEPKNLAECVLGGL